MNALDFLEADSPKSGSSSSAKVTSAFADGMADYSYPVETTPDRLQRELPSARPQLGAPMRSPMPYKHRNSAVFSPACDERAHGRAMFGDHSPSAPQQHATEHMQPQRSASSALYTGADDAIAHADMGGEFYEMPAFHANRPSVASPTLATATIFRGKTDPVSRYHSMQSFRTADDTRRRQHIGQFSTSRSRPSASANRETARPHTSAGLRSPQLLRSTQRAVQQFDRALAYSPAHADHQSRGPAHPPSDARVSSAARASPPPTHGAFRRPATAAGTHSPGHVQPPRTPNRRDQGPNAQRPGTTGSTRPNTAGTVRRSRPRVNTYVVPTDKRRDRLRLEIRVRAAQPHAADLAPMPTYLMQATSQLVCSLVPPPCFGCCQAKMLEVRAQATNSRPRRSHPRVPSDYVVPTQKRRQHLRAQVRVCIVTHACWL